jgi:hypothetical protein
VVAVLAREATGPHPPIDRIKLTASTVEEEEAAARQHTTVLGGNWSGSMKESPG